MQRQPQFLTASEAARQLGVTPKALRLYEQHGLITPGRTRAGWRAYGPAEVERAMQVVSFRKLGMRMAEIAALVEGSAVSRDAALAKHQSRLESQMRDLGATLRKVSSARNGHQIGPATTRPADQLPAIAFDLPWPWAGEHFSLPDIPPLTYITGPLGSGKTRFAMQLAEALPGGHFLSLERRNPEGKSYAACVESDAELRRLENKGATVSPALAVLVAALNAHESTPLVIDMVEQGLDQTTQLVLSRYLRHREHPARPLFLMTRSSAILDLSAAESGETIIYCAANHSPPMIVHADPLCPGYEAVATCLATPEVRARTSGVIAAWAADDARPAP